VVPDCASHGRDGATPAAGGVGVGARAGSTSERAKVRRGRAISVGNARAAAPDTEGRSQARTCATGTRGLAASVPAAATAPCNVLHGSYVQRRDAAAAYQPAVSTLA